ncbi:hypothetical protein NHX12_011033 [Muraenolepis orangiensis]|uniref:Sorting nexin C-terminal domain-containing protein n=1 Tax=Muraenolepis orangiensis TaxID=630683 RepID=A0A9Q0DFK1_9TELE|nr:hypothetical protein NHX12_011033 [Muraenolepis orangiensis]
MLTWRVWIAMLLGSLWYFSEHGQTATQYALCVLCCFLSTSTLILSTIGQESGTQTDEVVAEEEALPQDDIAFQAQYPNVKRSLRKVFECAYGQLVLPWYCMPEPPECQPLHQALGGEFDLIVDRFISRARDFDLCEAMVGSVRLLTQHLHNAKRTERDPLFGSRAEEMAVLRVFSEALVRNLFPESLCGLDVNRCALNEIVALKGLELLVMWLSDPDNLNQLVVSQMDTATPKSSVEELCGSDCEGTSSASQEEEEEEEESDDSEGEEGNEVSCENTEETENSMTHKERMKKRSKKLKAGWTKFVDKVKYKRQKKKAKKKKMKLIEQELIFKAMTNQEPLIKENHHCSREGSIRSQQDSDTEQGDLENYLASVQEDMMEFKLSYEMWRAGHWTVSIPHMEEDVGELFFTLHLAERDNPENLSWDIRKTYLQVIYFRNRWQDATKLPSITDLEPNSHQEASAELHEEVRASVELYLQELVSDELIGRTQPVFQFLCPLDKLLNEEENCGGLKIIMKGLSLARSQESLVAMREAGEDVQNHSDALPEVGEAPLSGRHAGGKHNKREKLGLRRSSGLHRVKGKDEDQGQRGQACRENLEATKAIFDLLKEISGNSILLNIFDAILMPVMPILKKKVNAFLSRMNPTELQMASYVDNMRDKQWPAGAAPRHTPPRTAEEKQETRDKAHQLINAKCVSPLLIPRRKPKPLPWLLV